MSLCRDCKHSLILVAEHGFKRKNKVYSEPLDMFFCTNPNIGSSKLTGGDPLLFCEMCRHLPTLCGVDATWFEASK